MIDHTFFDQPVKRRGTGCVKWDAMPADDVIPMWVADMDFAVAPAIQKGHQGSGRTPCLRLYARTRQLLRVGHPVVQTSPRMDDRARLDPLHDGRGACRIGHHQGFDTSWRECARPDSGLQLLLLQHTQSGMRDPGPAFCARATISRWTSTTSSASVPTKRPLSSCSATPRIRRAGCGRARNWSG